MRLLGFIFAASIALALLQTAAKLAGLLVLVAAIATFAARPIQTVGCLSVFILLGLFELHPALGLGLSVALVAMGRLAKARSNS